MIKGDYVLLATDWQNNYHKLRYVDNQGIGHYDESEQAFFAGTLARIRKINQRKGIATLYTSLPIGGYLVHDIPLASLEAVSKAEALIMMEQKKYEARVEDVRKRGLEWDAGIDYAGVPIGEIPRVKSFYGTRMELPSSSRGYFSYWNREEWIPVSRPEWRQEWTDEHEQKTKRIRLVGQTLDLVGYLHGKFTFKPNPDNLDMQRIAAVFADDMPHGVQLRPSGKLWW